MPKGLSCRVSDRSEAAEELRCVGSAGRQLLPALADPTLVLLKGVHCDVEHQLLFKLKTHTQ